MFILPVCDSSGCPDTQRESWLSMDNAEVRDEKPILDLLLVSISVYQQGFVVLVHFCAEAKAFPDLLPQRSQSIMK